MDCSVCSEQFSSPTRIPRVLPCGHSFCSICITRLTRDRTIECPNCRLPCSASNVRVNFALRDSLGLDGGGSNMQAERPFFEMETQEIPLMPPVPPREAANERAVSVRFISAKTSSDRTDVLVSVMPPAGTQR